MELPLGKTNAATQNVFSLPELLEHILSHLPWCDLFILQRTNTTFFSTISDSRALQERQGLHNIAKSPGQIPPPSAIGPWHSEAAFGISPIIPELLFSNPACFESRELETRRMTTCIAIRLHHRVRPPPRHHHHSASASAKGFGVPRPHDRSDQSLPPPSIIIHPNGSWRRLRIAVLPKRRMSIVIAVSLPGNTFWGGVDGTSPPSVSSRPEYDDGSTVTYWEKIELRTDEANFGDLAEILQEVTGRTFEEHAELWKSLSGSEWIGLGAESSASMTVGDGRLRDGGRIVIERRRKKG